MIDGVKQPARARTVNTYDQGRPSNAATSNLVTSTSTGARVAGASADADVRTTTTAYDWTLGQPTAVRQSPETVET
ncbi:MAG TPA: hypothetical protein VNU26_06410 [Mycobacteriales bacterium]|nr:hypothetical protein [Mycobacteriales bacterium]